MYAAITTTENMLSCENMQSRTPENATSCQLGIMGRFIIQSLSHV